MKPLCTTQEIYDLWMETPYHNDTFCYDCDPEFQGKMIRQFKCSNPSYSDGPNFAGYTTSKSGVSQAILEGKDLEEIAKEFEMPLKDVRQVRAQLVCKGLVKSRKKIIKIKFRGKDLTITELAKEIGVSRCAVKNTAQRYPDWNGDDILNFYQRLTSSK